MQADKEIRDHVISTAVSLAVGFAGYALVNQLANNSPEAVALAVVAGITTSLIFDRVAYSRKLDKTKSEIIESLRIGTPFEAGYRVFDREQDAINYLNSMLPTARSIWNTRISDNKSVPSLRFISSLVTDHDGAIMQAIKSGAEYRIIIESSRRAEINDFADECKKLSKTKVFGGVAIHSVEFNFAPVSQLIIFESRDGNSEALVGWAMGEETEFQTQVLLVRDKLIVDFYKRIFEKYTVRSDSERI